MLFAADSFILNFSNAWSSVHSLINSAIALIPQLLISLVIIVLTYFISVFVKSLIRGRNQNKPLPLRIALGRLSQTAVLFVGILLAVAVVAPDVSASDLLATLGVGGVAIGFAFKDILQNFLAGILLLIRQPFEIGDAIECNDFSGTVVAIDTRSTVLKTFDGNETIMPNGNLFTSPITIFSKYPERRSEYVVGIGYGEDIRGVQKLIHQVLSDNEQVLEYPKPTVHTIELGENAIGIRVRWWTKPGDLLEAQSEVITSIKEALDDASVEIPYPRRVLQIEEQDKPEFLSKNSRSETA